jgi:hypothetical protein
VVAGKGYSFLCGSQGSFPIGCLDNLFMPLTI